MLNDGSTEAIRTRVNCEMLKVEHRYNKDGQRVFEWMTIQQVLEMGARMEGRRAMNNKEWSNEQRTA